MQRRLSARSLIVAALLLLAPLTAFGAGQVGEPAANFNLTDTNGVNHMLSSHVGEVVYLFFVGHG